MLHPDCQPDLLLAYSVANLVSFHFHISTLLLEEDKNVFYYGQKAGGAPWLQVPFVLLSLNQTVNPESGQLLGNRRWKAPIANLTARLFSSMKRSLSTFPEIAIQKSAALGKSPPSTAKWSLQGCSSLTSADYFIWKCLHAWYLPMTSSSISRITWLLVRAGFCPAFLILQVNRNECIHPGRHVPAPQQQPWVPLNVGGCWLDCGAHCSASVLGWVQAGGPWYWCWWGCFPALLLVLLRLCSGLKPQFFSKATG